MLHWFGKRLRHVQEVKRDERGFTLIELLVVVIIIGILAAIAIPTFLNQRDKANTGATSSSLSEAVTANEAFYTQNSNYAASEADLEAQGFRKSGNVDVSVLTPNAGAGNFCLKAVNSQGGTTPMYASDKNRTASATACGT